MAPDPAKITIERQAGLFRRGFCHRHRYRQHGVRSQARLVVSAVEFDQRLVEKGLLGGIKPHDCLGNLSVDMLDGLQYSLAAVAAGVIVTQLDGLARAGGGAGRHRSAAHRARFEQHVALNSRVASGIENLAADNIYDSTHGFLKKSDQVFPGHPLPIARKRPGCCLKYLPRQSCSYAPRRRARSAQPHIQPNGKTLWR